MCQGNFITEKSCQKFEEGNLNHKRWFAVPMTEKGMLRGVHLSEHRLTFWIVQPSQRFLFHPVHAYF
jgi:hypothetical protein